MKFMASSFSIEEELQADVGWVVIHCSSIFRQIIDSYI